MDPQFLCLESSKPGLSLSQMDIWRLELDLFIFRSYKQEVYFDHGDGIPMKA